MRNGIGALGMVYLVIGLLVVVAGLLAVPLVLLQGAIGSYAVYDATQGSDGAAEAAVVFLGSGSVWLCAEAAVVAIGLLIAVTGWGVTRRRRWSRVLGLLVALVLLPLFPLGTVIGVVGLLVLSNDEVAEEFASG